MPPAGTSVVSVRQPQSQSVMLRSPFGSLRRSQDSQASSNTSGSGDGSSNAPRGRWLRGSNTSSNTTTTNGSNATNRSSSAASLEPPGRIAYEPSVARVGNHARSTSEPPPDLPNLRSPQAPIPPGLHADPPSSNSARSAPGLQQQLSSSSHSIGGSSVRSSSSRSRRSAASLPPITSPGAYCIKRTTSGPEQAFRIVVPEGVAPEGVFLVNASGRHVRVQCPPNTLPGQAIQITLPPEPVTKQERMYPAVLTSIDGSRQGGAYPMTSQVKEINDAAVKAGGIPRTMLVTVPQNTQVNDTFIATALDGQKFHVQCPPGAKPGRQIRIVPPPETIVEQVVKEETFQVAVPEGVQPGQAFALVANGQRVLVNCPRNVQPGQRIKFSLPVAQVAGQIELAYESQSGGWRRTIRLNDLKFQWVRTTSEDVVDQVTAFDFTKSAYCKRLEFWEGNDARVRTGTLSLVSADQAVVDSKLVHKGKTLVSYADIAAAQSMTLQQKTVWFRNLCTQLMEPWDIGHIRIAVQRATLLENSVEAIMSLGREELRQKWRIEFLGEPALDAGGVTREWFEIVSSQIFDPYFGLWLSSLNNQTCADINPASGLSCPDDHLIYFRFLGRLLGRALLDGQLVKGHMVRPIYKHLLGWPITFEDIKQQDEGYYNSLKKLTKMEDVSLMCLDFTVSEESLGTRHEVELIEGGSVKEVTNDNISEYLEANLRYRMLERYKPQLTELMLGFYDVVPEPALTIFDANELELILCGLPSIDMEDWKANTNYSGLFEETGVSDKVVEWFWEVVEDEFDQEMRARLLQFVTGTSGVPARGFSVLQGLDGNIKKFTVHGIDAETCIYPRSHTCFNRIDLPDYDTKEELLEKLGTAITLSGVGFGIE